MSEGPDTVSSCVSEQIVLLFFSSKSSRTMEVYQLLRMAGGKGDWANICIFISSHSQLEIVDIQFGPPPFLHLYPFTSVFHCLKV